MRLRVEAADADFCVLRTVERVSSQHGRMGTMHQTIAVRPRNPSRKAGCSAFKVDWTVDASVVGLLLQIDVGVQVGALLCNTHTGTAMRDNNYYNILTNHSEDGRTSELREANTAFANSEWDCTHFRRYLCTETWSCINGLAGVQNELVRQRVLGRGTDEHETSASYWRLIYKSTSSQFQAWSD